MLNTCVGAHYGMTPAYSFIQVDGGAGMFGQYEAPNYVDAEKCIANYFGLIAVGDASVAEVAKEKNIKNIMSVSYVIKPKWGFNQSVCVIVRGY